LKTPLQVQAFQGKSHQWLSAYAKEVTMEVTVQVPESSFSAPRTTPENFAREMKLAAVVKWYELGRISQSKGAEICGMSRAEFLRMLGDYKVSVIQYDEDTLDRELA
jgi:predicted HTH domain antitoxin